MNIQPPKPDAAKRSVWSWWYLLFIALYAASLYVPFFNRAEPMLAGIPFFYWFQLALILAGAIVTIIVYFATDE